MRLPPRTVESLKENKEMGASAREIERKAKQAPELADDKLSSLEGRPTSNAARYLRVAPVVVGLAVAAVVGVFIYRRTRRPTLRERLQVLSPEGLRSSVRRLKESAPSVTVRVNEKTEHESGIVLGIVRDVTPAIVGAAGTALVQRFIATSSAKRA